MQWLHSVTPVKTEEVTLLLVNLGRHASRAKVEDIQPEVEVVRLVAAILLEREEMVVVP